MKFRCYAIVSVVAFITCGNAKAADIVRSSEPVFAAPAFNWQGFYAGGEIGGSWARSYVDTFNNRHSPINSWLSKKQAFIGGLYAGYNFDAGGNLVIGIETDFSFGKIKRSDTFTRGTYSFDRSIDQKWSGSTRIRVGHVINRWLPYIAGGIAYTRIDASMSDNYSPTYRFHYYQNKTRAGWTVGTGFDYAVADNILFRTEYRYTDFGRRSARDEGALSFADIQHHMNDFRIGVAYKF